MQEENAFTAPITDRSWPERLFLKGTTVENGESMRLARTPRGWAKDFADLIKGSCK
jgi:hypothetical protein